MLAIQIETSTTMYTPFLIGIIDNCSVFVFGDQGMVSFCQTFSYKE